MQKPLVVANWKMNPLTIEAAQRLTKTVKIGLRGIKDIEVILCPSFTSLSIVKKELKGSGIKLGAQNLFWKELGAYTGEISARMLKDVGCDYVIIGHSERRQILGETNEMVNLKLKTALKAGLKPILCIGETLEERQEDKTQEVITYELISGLKDISGLTLTRLSIAYEPIWAIGSGEAAGPDEIMTARLLIQKILTGLYSSITAQKIRILYGGSVVGSNAYEFIKSVGMDGLLVGGASLNASEFINITEALIK